MTNNNQVLIERGSTRAIIHVSPNNAWAPNIRAITHHKLTDYDFINDEIIEVDRFTDPMVIIPQDNLKFSIINLIAYIIGKLVNDYMERYCKNSNSDSNGTCMITMKNEFLRNWAA